MSIVNVVHSLYIRRIPDRRRRGKTLYIQNFPYKIGFPSRKYNNDFTYCSRNPQLSRQHCQIEQDEGGIIYLKDLDSRLGTWVNGTRYSNKRVELHNGDVIGLIPRWSLLNYFGRQSCEVELVYQTPLE